MTVSSQAAKTAHLLAALVARLETLRKDLAQFERDHGDDEKSDNRYYTSGRANAAATRIKRTDAEIKLLEAALAEGTHG